MSKTVRLWRASLPSSAERCRHHGLLSHRNPAGHPPRQIADDKGERVRRTDRDRHGRRAAGAADARGGRRGRRRGAPIAQLSLHIAGDARGIGTGTAARYPG